MAGESAAYDESSFMGWHHTGPSQPLKPAELYVMTIANFVDFLVLILISARPARVHSLYVLG